MVIIQSKSKRKASGGRYKVRSLKRAYEAGRAPVHTKVGERKAKSVRTGGANKKSKLLSENSINIFNPKTKKIVKALIKTVVENPANRHFVRRNILTKGTIVETDKGKAKITSRPGQTTVVSGVLIE
ncbi:30S ribosomal protein S8e [Candidatus Woesearchaeota archaeon]|nr:30S ribosomal protein S8e [Candidatus Woesearchaeota archaeon]